MGRMRTKGRKFDGIQTGEASMLSWTHAMGVSARGVMQREGRAACWGSRWAEGGGSSATSDITVILRRAQTGWRTQDAVPKGAYRVGRDDASSGAGAGVC